MIGSKDFRFDFLSALMYLCDCDFRFKNDLSYFSHVERWSSDDKQLLLQKLAELFLIEDLFPVLVKHCLSEQVKINLLDKVFTPLERTSVLTQELTHELFSHEQECTDKNDYQRLTSDSMDVSTNNIGGVSINKEDLIGQYTTLCGVMLPCLPGALNLVDHSLVMVPSTANNLHSLVLSVATGNGVLLEGPIGCGKTALVEFVARATGRTHPPDFMKIQLGDQTDSKSLLGTYVCTDTPGEFSWQAGLLLQAVQVGYWILLEDIDLAPMDVISVLIPLLESRTLSVPAHGNAVKASPGFQLFATQRSYRGHSGFSYQVASANSSILEKLWTRVQIEPFSKEELTEVVIQKFPDLEKIAVKLVDIYCMLSADPCLVSSEDTGKCSLPCDKRQSSSRDLMKWCSRIAVTACGAPTLLDSKEVFLEAQDCFSAPLSKTDDQNLIDMAVGAKLGLTKEKIEFFSTNYKPNVHTSPLSMTIGRVTLKKKVHESQEISFGQINIPKFAQTRHSLVLLEKVAASIRNSEPVLLVGETGTGKTSTVQYLAAQCAVSLKVVNMSQQSDSSDLLGGYKPVEMKQVVAPVREKFEVLFCKTFSRKQNVKFLSHVQRCFAQGHWEILFKLMIHSQKNAIERVKKDNQMKHLLVEWQGLIQDIQQLQKQEKNAESALAFRFVEGTLVQALQNGDWVLLDEINLATPETLECLCGLLESSSGSVVLMERGDVTPTVRHEDFRLFACMNPATDVGKKDLPSGIRNRFTEIFVSELESTADLKTMVVDYLQGLSPNSAIVDGIVRFYLTVKHEADDKLTDGTGHKPHYSCPGHPFKTASAEGFALVKYVIIVIIVNSSLFKIAFPVQGFCLSFLTQLDRSSHPVVQSLIKQHILGHVNAGSMLKQPLPKPQDSGQYSNFEGFWIAVGSKEPVVSTEYVLTASVKANLKDLVRVVSARKLPVLIQGETSVGKTSLIQWLAKASGNRCVRINNHEHTDIQEYLGCYTSDENGKLIFKEGVLVDAMRKGHWIILDELNLAPSDVLEALNRLLDDNRELFIPETQETVVAHPMFMLFATQNPPGHYGGRKVLSRAFRNRFVELHFDELPSQELEVILHQRCRLPLSYAKKLVAIMLALQQLFAVNCHMHSESADFLGGLRPVRHRGQEEQDEQVSKLFEWCDGPLVQAMKQGAMFLVDEISLADDSVLERLNRVLEPERTLVLAEKGSDGGDLVEEDVAMLVAHKDFKIIGTMNPGGDFGKKELSPALRNRFTEIWCPPSDARTDLVQIIEHNIKPGVVLNQGTSGIGEAIVDFMEWFHSSDFGKRFVVSIRDLLSWVNFINTCSFSVTENAADENTGDKVLLSPALAYVHGACLVFLDALGVGSTSVVSSSSSSSVAAATALSAASSAIKDAYQACLEFLKRQVEQDEEAMQCSGYPHNLQINDLDESPDLFGIRPFFIPRGPQPLPENFCNTYTLSSPTTSQNAQRILRALQLPRPILLEGSPGVGKTSLVHAIAKASGHELIRINLSEQTDVTDLFGSDLPVEGGEVGQFVWRDGPLLKALKAGHWIVLDELNLASQSVLEGLNACLDHRAEVYIPELGMTFKVQRDQTRLFACQNPLNQGGGRKGLPKSFLNRFTQVYVEPLSKADLLFITEALYPQIDHNILEKMVTFNQQIHEETVVMGHWGRKGGPWELNLRDVFRWCDLLVKYQNFGTWNPGQFVHLIYCDRMRTLQDKQMVLRLFKSIFENSGPIDKIGPACKSFYITPGHVQVGHSWLPRCSPVNQSINGGRSLQMLHCCLPAMESVMTCLDMNWMAILVGPRSCGKTSLVHLVAQLTGNRLEVMAMNSAMDTTELLGGFEQADLNRRLGDIIDGTRQLILAIIREILICSDQMRTCLQEISSLYKLWSACSSNDSEVSEDENPEKLSHKRLDHLQHLLKKVQEICSRYELNSSDAVNIMERVQSLQKKLTANKDSSHCGGQFEWVDGQLVEALKSGYWLLIDNVNFCSPSVLDRLNALLEPGGVLTIDERGVIDGQIPSIKPHPNFRLILAMDPRYGEISRAMRNRGVEIFMLGEENGENYDDCDYQMMLNGLGLEDKTICDCLVAFHKDMGGSLLDMLHAASLTKQLLQGGSEEFSAVVTSLNQVYARNQTSVQSKQDVKDLMSKHTSMLETLGSAVHMESTMQHFPSAQEYHANSVVSTIKLQSLPLLHILQNGRSVEQLESAVLLFLERSSHYDWTSRLGYLQSVVDVLCAKTLFSYNLGDVVSHLKTHLKSFGVMFSSQLMDKLKIGLNNIQSTRFGRLSLLEANTRQRELPGELVTVVNHLQKVLATDRRVHEAYLQILVGYGHPAPFKSRYVFAVWEKMDNLCKRIDKYCDRSWKSRSEEELQSCKDSELKGRLAEVLKIMLDNRMNFSQEELSQCESILSSVEETISRNLEATEEIMTLDENSTELVQPTSVDTKMSNVAFKKAMSLLFGDVCPLQEGCVLGSLMLALANQMACGTTSLDSGAITDQIEALTTYQLKKTIRDPVIQVIFCHLGGSLSKGNDLNSHFLSIFRPVESEILTECLLLESRKLWAQSNQGKESNVFSVLGGAPNLLDCVSSRKLVEEGHGSSLTSLTIQNYHENLKQLEILSTHFWVNGDVLDSQNEVDRNSSIKLFIAKLFQVLLSIKESLPQSNQVDITSVVNRLLPSLYEGDDLLHGIHSIVDASKKVVQHVADTYKHCTGNVKQADLICNLLTACLEGVSRLPGEAQANNTDMLWDSICRGEMWTKLGLVQSLILSPVGPVDPVEKTRIELEYVNSEIQRIEEELKVRYYAEEIWTGVKTSADEIDALVCDEHRSESRLTSNPSRVGRLLIKLKDLRVQAENLSKNAAIRPAISQFDAILDDVKHFLHTIGETNSVTDLTNSMREPASQLYGLLKNGVDGNVLANSVTTALHRAKAWYTSVEKFIQRLRKDYPLYCDILGPFIAGVSQVMYGVSLMSSNLSTLFQHHLFRAQFTMSTNMQQCSGPDALLSFCEFPASSSLSCLDAAVSLMSPSVDACIQGLVKYLQDRETAAPTSAFLSYRVLQLSVLHLRNHSIQHGFLDGKLYRAVVSILEIFMNKWKIFKEEERQREDEEGSLFKFKNKTHGVSLSEDEENKLALNKAFPRFDDDFKDVMAPQDLNENISVPQDEDLSSSCVVKSDAELFMENIPNFSEVKMLHEETFCRLRPSQDFPLVEADCYRPNESIESLYLDAFNWGYETASVMNAIIPWLQADRNIPRPHLLQSSILKGHFQPESTVKQDMPYQKGLADKKPFDIYHDSKVQEVVRVKPVLEDFADRIHELLAEWPRHPALMQLLVVIQRILSFPVTSPVMKILTGLEVLLRKAQDWESNAAKHVSLRDHLDNVTQLIIQWRKMELKCWSTLLDVTTVNSAAKASQWWFHIYSSLVQSRTIEKAQEHREIEGFPDGSEIIEPLQRFIESSTLGEFASRLQMLFAFYKQMCYEETSTGGVKVSDVLWNLFSYYKQFFPSVEQSLLEMRKPIEKDLKDFVKIAKWNDSNFWAMKQAADKSHHALHKFVRRYEASLNEPVSKTLINVEKALSPPENKGNRINERKIVEADWFISSEALKAYCNRSLQFISTHDKWGLCLPSNQNRLTKLFKKMRQLSRQIISRQEFEPLVTSLDDFTGEVITTSRELQALDVSSQPKEKQTEMRKHIQQRKRKSLADLFKMLALLGVSYRKGLNLERQSTGKEAMLVAAVEEEAVTRSVELLSDRSPVGLRQLRESVTLANEDTSNRISSLPPQKDLEEHTIQVMDLLTNTAHVLQQMTILLKCCPNETTPIENWTPLPQAMLSSVAVSSADNPDIKEMIQTLENTVKKLHQVANEVRPYAAVSDHVLNNTSGNDRTATIASWLQNRTITDAFFKLKGTAELIDEMLPKFKSKCCSVNKGLGAPLVCLKDKILKKFNDFHSWSTAVSSQGETQTPWNVENIDDQGRATLNAFVSDVDALNTSLLLAVQRLAKISESSSKEGNEEAEKNRADQDGNENFQLQDGHLATRLHQNLLNDISSLNLDDVTKSISSLLSQVKYIADSSWSSSNMSVQLPLSGFCSHLLEGSIPLLHQYLNLSQNLLLNLLVAHRATSKLLSVLLTIFTDLGTRGFCVPPEIEEDEGNGSTEFEDIEGGGIGEGEGMKDVSDQIENEDQLEDAKQEGQDQDKKEDDSQQQIPDEENGIEMSENFEGALHDVEAEEEEDEENEEENGNEDDVDKQMGEVDGQDTEKLDEKMWGDSDDEEEKEEQEMKEDKGTGAEAEQQSQLVAKEDNEGSADESKEKTEGQRDADEELSEENINEAMQGDEGNLSDEGEDEQEGTGQQGKEEEPVDAEESTSLDLPDDLQLDDEGNEGTEDQPEEMETEEFEGDQIDTEETGDETAVPDDDQIDSGKDEQEGEDLGDEENMKRSEGDEKQDEGEDPKDEDAVYETDQEDWRTKTDTEPQENVQAVEDSGEGDGNGEQTDVLAGQSESVEGNEERGVGRAEALDDGHPGQSSQRSAQATADARQQSRQRKQMNRARSDRALGSMDETTHKRLKTVDETELEPGAEANETKSQDLFQHMRNDDPSSHDTQTLDSATADQAETQDKANFPEMHSDCEDEDEEADSETATTLLDDNEELPTPDKSQLSRLPPPIKLKMTVENKDGNEARDTEAGEEIMETNDDMGMTTERLRSTYHSSDMALAFQRLDISSLDPEKLRADLEYQLAEWSSMNQGTAEQQQLAQEAWRKYDLLTSTLSQDLCEQLRLVLEPSLATKLKGDYRSGKRLNMRKVIPYIASQFRKDKIWLRRTKPSKRQYQIMLAVDDSSSMNDNHSKQLAFESLAVISNALTRLEAGDLGVCSFGETVRLLHPFHEAFTDNSGARILQQFTFDQKKTRIAELLNTCTSLMVASYSRLQVSPRMRRETSQLLLIVSDGRGIFLEGMETVHKAVRLAREANIFMVFVILDNPANKDSVLDIKVPIFRPGKLPEIKSYMEQFPFPFYIILRDINALPVTLSDALRQWFELVSSLD
ncbi:Midasin [Stylophora pistillata]|uniref:Midasin n=1 Tax=Stylophora pistillata TaxID=50429 RepID=A0A2B4RHC7_STYPI|nr:Midasin [Stylophora pistillata]